ncbi:MAG TPA: GNAT family protein [Solirubrobacteraceae bacterium]|jgi:ribosomal-protein-alanine N-acetyltransferase
MADARVVLRPLAAADRQAFLEAMRASRRLHSPWLSPPYTAAEFASLLRRCRGERFESLLVCRREDGAIAGFFSLSEIVRGPFQNAFLGYGAVAAHAGRGYMGEGLELLLARAFGHTLRLHRVEANIQPSNATSIGLVRGRGFVLEGRSERYLKVAGRWRDHERWAIRAEQWRERHQLTNLRSL